MSETRYLLFSEDYDEYEFLGEAESLDAISPDVNTIYVVSPNTPVYRLHSEPSGQETIEGQGQRLFFVWKNGATEVVAPHYHRDEYRYGEPVPEGSCIAFNGFEKVILSDAEAAKIQRIETEARNRAPNGSYYTVEYPNGSTVQYQRLEVLGTGLMGADRWSAK